MATGALGKVYKRGEAIVRQGEAADCLYVIQSGQAEMVQDKDGRQVRLGLLGEQDFLGETAMLEHGIRSATVRAVSEVRAITVDRKTFLSRIHEDPSLVFRVLQKMSHRIRKLSTELVRIKGGINKHASCHDSRDPRISRPHRSEHDHDLHASGQQGPLGIKSPADML